MASATNSTSSILVPAGQADIALLKIVRDQLIADLNTAVRNVLGPDQPLIVRDLTANDVSPANSPLFTGRLSNPAALTAQTMTTMFSTVLTNQQAFGIYGYAPLSPSPALDIIQFGQGIAVTYARFDLDGVFADSCETVCYFNGPVFWTPNQTMTIQGVSNAGIAENAEQFNLYGLVVEPAGLIIQPVASA